MLVRNKKNGQYLEGIVLIKYFLCDESDNCDDFIKDYTNYPVYSTTEKPPLYIYCSSLDVDTETAKLKYKYNSAKDKDQEIEIELINSQYYGIKFKKLEVYLNADKTDKTSFKYYSCLDGFVPSDGSEIDSSQITINVYFERDNFSGESKYLMKCLSADESKGTAEVTSGYSNDMYPLNTKATITATPKDGNTFVNWKVDKLAPDPDNLGDFLSYNRYYVSEKNYTFTITTNESYTAIFKPNQYKIKFYRLNNDNTTEFVNEFITTYEESMPSRLNMSDHRILGYKFLGYCSSQYGSIQDGKLTDCGEIYYDATGKYQQNINFDNLSDGAEVALYGYYTPETYTITYHLDGGKLPGGGMADYVENYNCTTSVTPRKDITKTGYTFGGWYQKILDVYSGDPIDYIPVGSVGNKDFWAYWLYNSDKISTNEDIYNLCAYSDTSTYSLSESGNYVKNKYPTKSHILENNGGQLINILFSNSFSNDQCVRGGNLKTQTQTIRVRVKRDVGRPINKAVLRIYGVKSGKPDKWLCTIDTTTETWVQVDGEFEIDNFEIFDLTLKITWQGTYGSDKYMEVVYDNGKSKKYPIQEAEHKIATTTTTHTSSEKFNHFININKSNVSKEIYIRIYEK
jgi:hypothetical protein